MPAASDPEALTLADLLERFGPIPAHRIRTFPPPGTATEEDLLVVNERGQGLCELVDGVLVEKAMGYFESRLAAVLVYFLESFLDTSDLGVVLGADAASRFARGLVRVPDVSFVSWGRLARRRIPEEPIPDLVPDLVVEVVSRTNTPDEMRLKRRDYFRCGVRLVWEAYPASRSVRVYRSAGPPAAGEGVVGEVVADVVGEAGVLDGGDVLPGFRLAVRDWFARAERA